MIISASRRTDIPACYSQWMCQRIKEGYVLVRNPMNAHQISKISLSPDVVDGIVFWTKNPVPMLDCLELFDAYHYYFQFTLTAYDRDVEPNLPSKNNVLIPAFKKLSGKIGRERVLWRYDPIFFNDRYTMEYHCKYFKVLASKLCDYTEKCTVSFLDFYRSTEKHTRSLKIIRGTKEQQMEIMGRFSQIAREYGFDIDTCAEDIDLENLGISRGCCIDGRRFERIGKMKLSVSKDPNQRPQCGCVSSIDIGAYDTCTNGCLYCYANHNPKKVLNNVRCYRSSSPLLCSETAREDKIKERTMSSCIENQISIFDL